jgi:arylsulfatase A-like enzyme
MTSDTTADAPRRGFLVRGLLAGAAAGALTGLLDAARSAASPNELVQASDALAVVGFYACWFAPFGVLAALAARRFDWPHRMLDLLVAVGAAWFFVTAWLNVSVLPGFTSRLSVAVDLLLLAGAAVLVSVRYRAPGEDVPHTRRWTLLALSSAFVAFVLPFAMPPRGDGPAPSATVAAGARRPNVLLYLVDTVRADHLSAYGYPKPTSPELDAFAADATRFEDCRAATSWTKPSTASLMTSMMPSTHACVEQREVLVPDAETLAEVLRAAGWRTAAFVDNPFVSREFGFAQGFDVFDEVRPSVVINGTLLGKALFMTRVVSLVGKPFGVGVRVERGCRPLHASLLGFVDAQTERQPWFAYVHAMEPHLPYEPAREDAEAMGFPAGEGYAVPPAYNGILPFQTMPEPDPALLRKLVAQYDGEIRGWSRAFGELVGELRRRGRLDDTVIVVVSDHGEEFHEHGGWTHGHSLHREVTQVPLVVRVPDSLGAPAQASRGRVVQGIATLLDVAPTILDLCSVGYPAGDEPSRVGESLVPQILGTGGSRAQDAVPATRPILGEVTMSPVSLRSIREGRWMFIRSEQPLEKARLLFDDVSDPGHRRDRWDPLATEGPALEARLDEFFRGLSRIALTGRERTIDPETAEHLRRLGYTGGK